jgi:hypothetical protein
MHSTPQLQVSVRTPLKREVIYTIKSMKNGKAARLDNILAGMLKLDSSEAADILLPCSKKFGRGKDFLRSGKKE